MANGCFLQLKHKAKSQRPRTKSRLFRAPLRPIQWRMSCAGNTPFFRAHFQSTRGRGSWDANGTPQSTELQAVLEFPPDSQALSLTAALPAPLPSEHSVEYTKIVFRVNENLHSWTFFFNPPKVSCLWFVSVEERPFRAAKSPSLCHLERRPRELATEGKSKVEPCCERLSSQAKSRAKPRELRKIPTTHPQPYRFREFSPNN